MNRRLSIPDQLLKTPIHGESDGEWIDMFVEGSDNQKQF